MKHIKVLLAFAALLSVTLPLQAQKFLKKELRIENEEEDGFEFRWYLYSYLQGQDTLYAAFTLTGDRITPNSARVDKYHHGYYPFYCGGGIFKCDVNTIICGYVLCEGYNLQGQLVFPSELEFTSVHYEGDGIIILSRPLDYNQDILDRRRIDAAYDDKGKCLIPAGLEYNWIAYYPEKKCFWCDYEDVSGNKTACFTYTADGKYFAEGYYYSSGRYDPTSHYDLSNPEERAIFDKHKKPNPYITTNTNTPAHPQQPAQQQQVQQQQPTPQPQPQPRQPQPMQVWVPCYGCNGSGQCHICGGLGWNYTSYDSHATCTICGGNGKCNMCAGHGGHNEIQYR